MISWEAVDTNVNGKTITGVSLMQHPDTNIMHMVMRLEGEAVTPLDLYLPIIDDLPCTLIVHATDSPQGLHQLSFMEEDRGEDVTPVRRPQETPRNSVMEEKLGVTGRRVEIHEGQELVHAVGCNVRGGWSERDPLQLVCAGCGNYSHDLVDNA